jgi:undecaprenyl-diphosphatase
MIDLDKRIVIFLNSFAHRSWIFDRIVVFLAQNSLAEGALALAVFYFVWFQPDDTTSNVQRSGKRQALLYSLLICVPAVLLSRALAWGLPYRMRPMRSPDLPIRMAYGFDPGAILNWSSFPSDHAVLFFALATGVFLVHRKAGLLLYAHAVLFDSLPRLYLGIHYASDLLAGALLGCGIGYSARWFRLQSMLTRPALRLQKYSPGIFYACFFYLASETADLYEHLHTAAAGAWQVLNALFHLY